MAMKITKEKIKQVVLDSIKEMEKEGYVIPFPPVKEGGRKYSELEKRKVEREREQRKAANARSRSYKGGDLMSLAAGITEEEIDEEQCSVGNPQHSDDGTFSSKANAKSWSIRAKKDGRDCDRGQYKGNKHGGTDREECGRGSIKRCKGGLKGDHLDEQSDSADYKRLYLDKKSKLAKAYEVIRAQKAEIKRLRERASLEHCLTTVAAMKSATDGKFGPYGKKK